MTALLDTLTALELRLQSPEVRSHRERLQALLHPDFEEVGRSGRRYDKGTIVAQLLSEPVDASGRIESQGFAVSLLGDGVALLTYQSQHRSTSGEVSLPARRASVWVRGSVGAWQLRYHQGTPLPDGAVQPAPVSATPTLTDLTTTVERMQNRLARHTSPAVQAAYRHYLSLLPRFAHDLGADPRQQLLACASALMVVDAAAKGEQV